MTVNWLPDGCGEVTPYLLVQDVSGLVEFMREAFGAVETHRTATPEGRVMHCQVKIGDSLIMMGEPPGDFQPLPGSLHLYVKDVDATYNRSLQAGAEKVMEPADQFYGDRSAGVKDRWGNYWWIATHVKDVSGEEMQQQVQSSG